MCAKVSVSRSGSRSGLLRPRDPTERHAIRRFLVSMETFCLTALTV